NAQMTLEDGAVEKEGSVVKRSKARTLTPIVVPKGQHYEVINDHCSVNVDDILACDESSIEKKGEDQEGEAKGMIGTHFPNRQDNSQLAGLFTTAVLKEQNDEELDLGKSHKDIPSICEQDME
ncbi:hypothetical protein KI387_026484, partial [Taxus chinensis]